MLNTIFLIAAVIGGTIMVCQFLLTFMGMGDDGAGDMGDVGADADFGGDAELGVDGVDVGWADVRKEFAYRIDDVGRVGEPGFAKKNESDCPFAGHRGFGLAGLVGHGAHAIPSVRPALT